MQNSIGPIACYSAFLRDAISFFTWLLFAALTSDIIDGVIARVFNMKTKLGAFLDSLADMATYVSAVTGMFVFKFDFILEYRPQMIIILGFYVLEKVSAFCAVFRESLTHFIRYTAKITAYAQGAFVMSLFLFGFKAYLFYPAMALCILANIEE